MIRRLALIGSVAVLSAVAFAPKAQAQTQDIDFGVTINNNCIFSGVTTGNLAQNGASGQWLESSSGLGGIGARIGGVAVAQISCPAGGTLAVGLPVKMAAPAAFVDTAKQAMVFNGFNYTTTGSGGSGTGGLFDDGDWQKPTAPLTIPSGGAVNYTVGMVVGVKASGGGLPAGNYQYRVTLTATPN